MPRIDRLIARGRATGDWSSAAPKMWGIGGHWHPPGAALQAQHFVVLVIVNRPVPLGGNVLVMTVVTLPYMHSRIVADHGSRNIEGTRHVELLED
ncbi:hypothetical protein D3C81_1870330 [compost metagenome]